MTIDCGDEVTELGRRASGGDDGGGGGGLKRMRLDLRRIGEIDGKA